MSTLVINDKPTMASRAAMTAIANARKTEDPVPEAPAYLANPVKYYTDKVEDTLDDYSDILFDDFSRQGITANVKVWYEAKQNLIELFRKHPNWNEEAKQIVFKTNIVRECDTNSFIINLGNLFRTTYNSCWWNNNEILRHLSGMPVTKLISEADAEWLNSAWADGKFKAGQKFSRVINKICGYLGMDKHEDYNRLFAKVADAINPLTITAISTISVNILDFLFMSNGNSWASCHTIIDNPGDNYNGCYRGGTLSYAADKVTFIFSVIDANYDGEDYSSQQKIMRQTFFYEDGYLSQQRLYPQSNDSSEEGNAYTKQFRQLVETVIAECESAPNLWNIGDITYHTENNTFHYADYFHFKTHRYVLADKENGTHKFYIGGQSMCTECGKPRTDSRSSTLLCSDCFGLACRCCGGDIDEDDDYEFYGGYWVCNDCLHWCNDCDCAIDPRDNERYDERGNRICESCFDSNYDYCSICGEVVFNEVSYRIDDTRYCNRCYDDIFRVCTDCGCVIRYDEAKEYDGGYYCEDCYENVIEDEENEEEIA